MSEDKEPYLDSKPQVDLSMTLGEMAQKTRQVGIEGMGETKLEELYKAFEATLSSQANGDYGKMESITALLVATSPDQRNKAMAFLWLDRHSERLRNMTLRELAHLMAKTYPDREPYNFWVK
jgi:outer membrane lipoprotein-sorting protein